MYSYNWLVGQIVSGLMANLMIPSWYWDTATGKCISANTGWLKWEKLTNVLEGLSIKLN
jgi:hypothetical protein